MHKDSHIISHTGLYICPHHIVHFAESMNSRLQRKESVV